MFGCQKLLPRQPPAEHGYDTTTELQPAELQDFVDPFDKIIKAGAGLEMHYRLFRHTPGQKERI
jgi:hypothetical protein